MKIKFPQFIFFIFLATQVFCQNKIDSLEYFYSLDLSASERFKIISRKFITPHRKDTILYKLIVDKNYLLALKTNDIDAISYASLSLGSYYLSVNNEADALVNYFKSLKGFEATHKKNEIALACMSIGQTYKALEDYKKSFEFLKRSIEIIESLGKKDIYYYGSLIHYANVAKELKDYTTAFIRSKQSLVYFKDFPFFRVFLENNIGFYYLELFKEPAIDSLMVVLKINKKQQLLDSSLYYYNKTLETAKSLEQDKNYWKAFAYSGKGQNAHLRKNNKLAVQFLDSTISISYRVNLTNDLLKKSYNSLYNSHLSLGNFKKALINYKKFIEYRDKIQSDKNKMVLVKQSLQYEYEKKIQAKENKIKEKNRYIFQSSLVFFILLIILSLFIKKRRLSNEKRLQQQYTNSLLINQENERRRISEDLHDGLGQSLLLLKNQLTKKDFLKSKELLDSSIEEMRSIVKTLYPFQLTRVGISIALENLVLQLNQSYKDAVFFSEIEDIKGFLKIDQETNVFRIVQECLSNIIKHANADSAKVSLTLREGMVKIKIQDNGKGFDFDKKKKELKTLGLKTIQERVNLLHGVLEIKSSLNAGSTFIIKFPLTPKKV